MTFDQFTDAIEDRVRDTMMTETASRLRTEFRPRGGLAQVVWTLDDATVVAEEAARGALIRRSGPNPPESHKHIYVLDQFGVALVVSWIQAMEHTPD